MKFSLFALSALATLALTSPVPADNSNEARTSVVLNLNDFETTFLNAVVKEVQGIANQATTSLGLGNIGLGFALKKREEQASSIMARTNPVLEVAVIASQSLATVKSSFESLASDITKTLSQATGKKITRSPEERATNPFQQFSSLIEQISNEIESSFNEFINNLLSLLNSAPAAKPPTTSPVKNGTTTPTPSPPARLPPTPPGPPGPPARPHPLAARANLAAEIQALAAKALADVKAQVANLDKEAKMVLGA